MESQGSDGGLPAAITSGLEKLQPLWDKFRNDIEIKADILRKEKDKEIEVRQAEVDHLKDKVRQTKEEYEEKIKIQIEEHDAKMEGIRNTYRTQIQALKDQVFQTMEEGVDSLNKLENSNVVNQNAATGKIICLAGITVDSSLTLS